MSLSNHFAKTYNIFREVQSLSLPHQLYSPHLKRQLLGHFNHGYPHLIRNLKMKPKAKSIHFLVKAL